MGHEAAMTEIQSVRQKVAEAYHIQRQYRTIMDVLTTERIGHESQLQELEKNIAELKAEILKLKVQVFFILFLSACWFFFFFFSALFFYCYDQSTRRGRIESLCYASSQNACIVGTTP